MTNLDHHYCTAYLSDGCLQLISSVTQFKKEVVLLGEVRGGVQCFKYKNFFVQVRSSRQQVIVPFREPTSQLANPTRIQQLQQQASILTAAVKGGQAFVAATTGQKKTTVVAPAAPTFPSTAQTGKTSQSEYSISAGFI